MRTIQDEPRVFNGKSRECRPSQDVAIQRFSTTTWTESDVTVAFTRLRITPTTLQGPTLDTNAQPTLNSFLYKAQPPHNPNTDTSSSSNTPPPHKPCESQAHPLNTVPNCDHGSA
ncbi:hypothetical protein G7K_1904-t1 [Saitoella complicata NRRL Y-17804]|uniref:Uncharacterized protein n=1 Tax=Saitoella complicata (strain BCRC 22490 / CBS 7301 / JCM 7358 / NBRC 10748 / NRRL Y-17804) TaxID=698492 RepID=A0A0E9NE64_SAICN|nr:hypothetical protein G7K_1904-t1 [Saitoella complicata NRRL Y-17804]